MIDNVLSSLLQTNTLAAALAALGAFALAVVLLRTQQWHGHWSIDSHIGIQKSHSQPTARIGGVAILGGVLAGYFFAPLDQRAILWPLILAGLPAFGFGLLEDVTRRVSVRARLLATMACGVLGWAITGYAITRVNVPGVDWLLGITFVSVVFTAFAVGGIANAINIIDGFNGLAAGSVTLILCGFASISFAVGDPALAYVSLILAGGVLGFLLVNWPLGKLFLGDGGAYFVGFAIAWLAVLLMARHPEVSAWALLLLCAFPFLEVVFSIARRHRRGLSPGAPDRLHLHSLVKRRIVCKVFPKASALAHNSITGAMMWIATLVPVLMATAWPSDRGALALGLAVCAFAYSSIYARLTQFVWCFGAATTGKPKFA